jgi:ankyrin repeat protein
MNSPTGSALTEAIAAIDEGNLTRLRDLVHLNPVFASARDDKGVSLIMRALHRRRTDMVELLLSADPELDLFTASALGRTAVVTRLLDDDPQAVDSSAGDGFTPLHLAAEQGNLEMVRALLAHGARIDLASGDGKTALQLAEANGHQEVVCLLGGHSG